MLRGIRRSTISTEFAQPIAWSNDVEIGAPEFRGVPKPPRPGGYDVPVAGVHRSSAMAPNTVPNVIVEAVPARTCRLETPRKAILDMRMLQY